MNNELNNMIELEADGREQLLKDAVDSLENMFPAAKFLIIPHENRPGFLFRSI